MQNISQTLISLCRASCFSQGETLREQVGEPQGRTGFSAPGVVRYSVTCA
ncbi:hypothetical protein [Nostoc sp. 'Peltigera malacea cyanobiont' DB3992]|nr:hypothetical protein [Nostoc sp. 'Peltigera malacea cyanobiont' DB3992]